MRIQRRDRPVIDRPRRIQTALWLIAALALSASALSADEANDVNARLYKQLSGSASEKKIEKVSGQLYVSKEHMDAAVIGDALGAMLESQSGKESTVAVRRGPSLNFEIHFKKNTAELTPESLASLDELGKALGSGYPEMRFVIGGHTDLDGDPAINLPLSQARADSARAYLVKKHAIAEDRLVARGFGSAEPLKEVEKTKKDKLYNRRVDLRPLR